MDRENRCGKGHKGLLYRLAGTTTIICTFPECGWETEAKRKSDQALPVYDREFARLKETWR